MTPLVPGVIKRTSRSRQTPCVALDGYVDFDGAQGLFGEFLRNAGVKCLAADDDHVVHSEPGARPPVSRARTVRASPGWRLGFRKGLVHVGSLLRGQHSSERSDTPEFPDPGVPVDLAIEDGRLVITPPARPSYSLDELLGGVTEKNLHAEVDAGAPRGGEVW